jgi:DNA-binding CsgD family transcriptional regulator
LIARQGIADLALRGLPPMQLAERICIELQQAISSDGFRLFALDPSTRLINRTLAASENDGTARNEWLRDVYLAESPIGYSSFPTLMNAGISVAAFHDRQDQCWGIPKPLMERIPDKVHWRFYHTSQTPTGGVLFASFANHGHWVALLQLYRRDQIRPFRPTDVAFLRLLASTIGQALESALIHERVQIESLALRDASGFLLLEGDGRLRFSTPSGEALAEQLRNAEYPTGDRIPTAIRTAVASLHAGKQPALIAPTPAGLVRVEASSGGQDDSVAVVLVPIRPPELPHVPDDWGLTIQETQVVELLVQGLSNAEIARRLASSERTIESHLTHVYEKIDVHSRNQVLARLFTRIYLPSLTTTP